MLHVEALTKCYGKQQVLTDISFTINTGEIVGLVGENGAGKSTLLSILAMLQQATKGSIHLDEQNYDQNRKRLLKRIGFVPG